MVREIYLHGPLNKDENYNDIDHVASTIFYKKLHELERQGCTNPILIHLHTIGGDWNDGMAIYDTISYSNANITIIGHGCVYSIGTIIMQSAKKRYLMPNCSFMVHYGSCDLSGDHKSAVNTAEYYKVLENTMLDIYASRCVNGEFFYEKGYDHAKTKTYIQKQLDKISDWYLTPEEAVYYGFADKVLTKREYNGTRKIVKRRTRSNK